MRSSVWKYFSVYLAGLYAALGGLLGKLSGYQFSTNPTISYFWQSLLFLLMIMLNSASLTLYVKALQTEASFKTTVTISSVNFFLSGIFGVLCFGEITGLIWWFGLLCVIIGIFLINSSDAIKPTKSQ